MPKFIYNFVVNHIDAGTSFSARRYRFRTMYTAMSDKEYDDKSFSFVASRLVLAERVMLFGETQITHVVVFEHRPRKWYDSQTVTHTLLPAQALTDILRVSLGGARAGREVDALYGLQWKRHSKVGKRFQGYFPACVGPDDATNPTRRYKDNGCILLHPEGPVYSRCWPFYADQLAQMPQIQDRYSIDRFGRLRDFGEHTSGRRADFVSDMAAVRGRINNFPPLTRYIERIMTTAQDYMFRALQNYHYWMNNYDHRWGDGHLPDYAAGMGWAHALASVWYPLGKAFGYTIDEEADGWIAGSYTFREHQGTVLPTNVQWKMHGREIDNCLKELFKCQDRLNYFFGFKTRDPSIPDFYHNWRSHRWNDTEELKAAVYEDWDKITGLLFQTIDCFNVLDQILIVKEPRAVRGTRGPTPKAQLNKVRAQSTTYPSAVPFAAMLEVTPFPKEPYLKTPPPPPPPEPIPQDENIGWDSGPPDEDWTDDDEDWGAQMKEAVRTALGQLEFVRRWIGKIRKQMIYYKNIPFEKLAPEHDEVKNPLTGEDIPDEPFNNFQ
jgi:hypothetical protein